MKNKLMTLLLLCSALVPATAQTEKSNILVHRVDGSTDTLLLNNVRDIYHSRLDANGVEQNDITTLRLRMVDGVRVYDLKDVDYVVMPRFGRVISFMGTTKDNNERTNAPRRTSVSGDFPGQVGDTVVYNWVYGDRIFLESGVRSNIVASPSGSNKGVFTFNEDLFADQYVVYYPGQNATVYNTVTIPTEQNQTKPDNSDHLGTSGDCGTAVAVRQANSDYIFSLDHKTAVICFLPRIDSLGTMVLKSVSMKADKNIAGEYTLSQEGLTLKDGTGRDSITLKTSNFTLPHQKATAQDTVASYMVVAPQSAQTAVKIYYRVYDSKSEIDTTVVRNVTFKTIKGATVYPITHKIPVRMFLTAFTDSARWDFDQPATLYGSVNLPVEDVGIIWGFNKNLSLDTKEQDIPLHHDAELTFNTTPVEKVKQKAYYYRAYAKEGGRTYWGKVEKFGMDREIVNMGTSVRWSSINMGAVTAEDPGNQYAWGELTSKDDYSQATYQYYDNGYQNIGSNIAGNPLYDVATAKWRGCWRLPTKTELDELRSKCSWSWVDRETEDGRIQRGLLVENVNNNPDSVLFLPADGYRNGTSHHSTDYCYYQSATEHTTQYSKYQYNNENNWDRHAWKYEGLSIRPVFESNIETNSGVYLFTHTDSISYSADHTSTKMFGTTRGLDDVVTDITQGFVIGTTEDVQLGSADLEVTLTQQAADNGSYNIPLTKEQMNELDFATKYYVRSYLTYDGETWYGDPLEMLAMTITTDSTNWEVGKTSARLCGTVTGITESVKETTEIGFVVGTDADVTLETTGHIEIKCDSTVNNKFVCEFDNIDFKQYYYRAFVRQGGRVAYGDPKMLGLEFVDLGLPSGLKWANINVGSQTPMDNGNFYAWGEVQTKSNYHQNTYSVIDVTELNGDINGTTHDAAQVNWKGPWRMPTKSDVQELLDNVTAQRTTLYGKSGFVLTSKVNGNKIFMPFTGYYHHASWSNANDRLISWTSTISNSSTDVNSNSAWFIDDENHRSKPWINAAITYQGLTIRPVALVNDTLDDRSMIQLTTDSVQWEVGQSTATLHGYLLGLRYNSNATESGFAIATTPNVSDQTPGVQFLKTNEGELYNVASGHFKSDITNVEDGVVYYYRAYVKVGDKYYFANEREFGRRIVDLGLNSGVLWSNINLGASSSDDSGDYYAWGETTTKTDFTRPATYPDLGADIAGSINDAAHVNWGGLWRLPTQDDIRDLLTKCTWTEVTKYGQNMYKVVGPSGDSIFIAKRGSMNGTSIANDGTRVSMWTSNLNDTEGYDKENAYGTSFFGSNRTIDAVARYLGYTIRPVMKYNKEYQDTKFYLTTDSTNWQVGVSDVRLIGSVAGLDQLDANTTVVRGFVVGYNSDDDALKIGGADVSNIVATKADTDNSFRGSITYDKDTTFYYRAYVKIGDDIYYGNTRRYGLELVDMGNGIKWANINIGAQISSDLGNRYAWGETTTKTNYTQTTYKHYSNGYVNIGADISNKSSYDAVKANWTGTWRMPTNAEMTWLVDSCDWTWTTEDGVAGYRVTSRKQNDKGGYNNIFLPAVGYQTASFYEQIGNGCYYWTSVYYNDGDAYALQGGSTTAASVAPEVRYYGISVRPVTTAGANEGGGGDITGGHQQGNSQQTGGDGSGNGGAGTGDTGGLLGD